MNDQSACEAGEPAHSDTKGSDQPVLHDQTDHDLANQEQTGGHKEGDTISSSLNQEVLALDQDASASTQEATAISAGGRVGGALADEPPAAPEHATLEVSFTDLSGGAIDLSVSSAPAAPTFVEAPTEAFALELQADPPVTEALGESIDVPEGFVVADLEAVPDILFSDLGLSEPILRAIEEKGYRHPTPIQAQAIPAVLSGRDVMGVAQTGTGKTASFTLPMLDILSGSRARARMPRSLILEPTRELALQVAENFVEYGKHLKLNHALLIGGESLNDQKDALMKGVDVLIATPGRLIDLFERGGMMLTDAKLLVIDEADRMLDMGFIPDVEKIVAMLPKTRQTLFFSATMAPEIRRLSDAFLTNPRMITVSKSASVATTIVAGLALVAEHDKREALRRLIRSEDVQNALIFCNRKIEVDILYKSLTRHGFSVGALHGDMSQPARFATLEKFKKNELRLLVCSDVAARGIDIGGLSHVFNFDVPHHAEDYVHRIGRTGRAGLKGHAFTLATPDDRQAVEAVEKLTGAVIPRIAVEGLDVVEWSEDDGRKRRGRGGKPAARSSRSGSGRSGGRGSSSERAETAVAAAPEVSEPTPDADGAAVTEKPARSRSRSRGKRGDREPKAVAAPEAAASPRPQPAESHRAPERSERGDRGERPERGERIERPERQERPERSERAPSRDYSRENGRDFRNDRPREYRRREEDLGPSVLAFGEDIPAFMLLPTRRGRADFVAIDFNAEATEAEYEEADRDERRERDDDANAFTFVDAPETLMDSDRHSEQAGLDQSEQPTSERGERPASEYGEQPASEDNEQPGRDSDPSQDPGA